MFWFKPKEIVVDCFTPLESVYSCYPIENSIKFYPQEIKNIESYYKTIHPETKIEMTQSTIKRCIGITEYYKSGFIIPMWTDFISQPKTASRGETAIGLITSPFTFQSHPQEQYRPTGMFKDHFQIKLMSPWRFQEKTGVSFSWNQPTWNLYKNITDVVVVPAVTNFKHQTGTHINVFINKNSDPFTIEGGTPMVHLIPLSDKRIKIKNHLISLEEFDKKGIPEEFSRILPNRYTRYQKASNKDKTSKCPFGFGK